MSLYKYLTPDRLDVLKHLLIRFTQPTALNDPFEFRPLVEGFSSPKNTARTLEEELDRQLPETLKQFPRPYAEVAEIMLKDRRAAMLEDARKAVEKTHPQVIEEIFNFIGSKLGILSLSETAKSASMWDRYAAASVGFVLEFDDKHPWFCAQLSPTDDFRHLRKVSYVDRASPRYMTELSGHDVFYSKLKEWEHEREWRIVRPLEEAQRRLGAEICLFEVPASAILGVIKGPKASAAFGVGLKAVLASDARLSHVRVYDARISQTKNAIEIIGA